MGVQMLYTFLKEIDALKKVKISEEADYYRKIKNKTPVVAIDGINLMYSIYSYYRMSWSPGGQLKEYMEHFEYFIDSFQREGIDLIFFFDCANVMFNVDGWIKRKRKSIDEVHRFFDRIEYNNSSDRIYKERHVLVLPKNIMAITVFLIKQKGCKIKMTIAECDRELALFGRENDCMGILATDTDFIIYDTVKIYTTLGMDLSLMSFYIYDKIKVREKLMLKASELPLFASLVGNDYTNPNHDFTWKKWNSKDVEKNFLDTANYIMKLNLKTPHGKILKNDIKRISRNYFRNERMFEVLQESIDFYDIKLEINDLASVIHSTYDRKWKYIIKTFHQEFYYNSDCLDVLIRLCYQDTVSLQDFRCTDIPSVLKVLEQLRVKMYGILLFEKPGLKEVTEWHIVGDERLGKPKLICPQFPRVHHPGIISLIRGQNKDASWILLGDTFNLDPGYMKNLPNYLLIPALTFRYLKDKVIFQKWEINALILSAILVKYFTAQQLRSLDLNHVRSRPIRLYNLVTSSFEAVLQIFQILGNLISPEEAVPSNYQDGKLFQLVYQLSFDEHLSLKEILMKIFDSSWENSDVVIETSLELFDVVSSFIDK